MLKSVEQTRDVFPDVPTETTVVEIMAGRKEGAVSSS